MPQSEYWPFESHNIGPSDPEPSAKLREQIGVMEGEMKEIQMELAAIRRDRMSLSSPKQISIIPQVPVDSEPKYVEAAKTREDPDYKRLPQISKLREELIRAKNAADEERFEREKYEGKLKDLESKLNSICNSCIVEDNHKEAQEEIRSLKNKIRNMEEEEEEMKVVITEKNDQLQNYRLKYHQAQQEVEELKRAHDLIEYENKQISDHLQIEIQKMKMQFQEKLQELAPLPDLLKGAQIQLQEARQLQKLSEENSQQLATELHKVKEKVIIAVNNSSAEKAAKALVIDENREIKTELDVKTKEIDVLHSNVDDLKCKMLRLEEKLVQLEARYKEKAAKCEVLAKDLEELRVENSRTLTRNKERSDSMRHYLQTQISELERHLIQSRAQCRAFQKERDEIRQRMQIQVNDLHENFEMVEIRLRTLQTQIASLKESYVVILADVQDSGEFNKIATTSDYEA